MNDHASQGFTLPNPRGHAAARRPGSARRTSSIDVSWPFGRHGVKCYQGIARDVYTPPEGGVPRLESLHEMRAEIGPDRSVLSLHVTPCQVELSALIGIHRAGQLRQTLDALLVAAGIEGSPLHLLVDDIPGVTTVADWAWSRWPEFNTLERKLLRKAELTEMEGVCVGFRPGSSALGTDGSYQDQRAAPVVSLVNPADPQGWHGFPPPDKVSLRRSRLIDVWLTDDIEIEAVFQDSATTPEGGRAAVHEYSLRAVADIHTRQIKSIAATPHVLPFGECPSAVGNLSRLIGLPLATLRDEVLHLLRRTQGCTHLNDTVRALADVPALAAILANHQR